MNLEIIEYIENKDRHLSQAFTASVPEATTKTLSEMREPGRTFIVMKIILPA